MSASKKVQSAEAPVNDLDKIATQIYNTLKKKPLTVDDVRSVMYRVNKKAAQNSMIGGQ